MARSLARRALTARDLRRPVVLHATADGVIVFGAIVGDDPTGHTGDWRDVAIDLIIEGRNEEAVWLLVENRNEPMLPERERITYTLPVFSVDTIAQARALQVRFCSLLIGDHPLLNAGERAYRVTRWDGSIDDLNRVGEEMAAFWDAYLDNR